MTRAGLAFALTLMLAPGCGDDGSSPAGDAGADGALDGAPDAALGDSMVGAQLGSFQLTYYYVTAQADFTGASDTALYTPSCTLLAMVPSAFSASLRIEGTGRLSDGTVVNVSGACSCPTTPCYARVDALHPWGVGVQGRALVPFRSLAVDRTVIPYGSKLYIREFDGVRMPDAPPSGGFVHDGCFSADDTGGHIIGKHIDFFAALRADYRALDAALRLTTVTVARGGTRCP